MIPVNFEGAVLVGKPSTMTDEECSPIYAAQGIDQAGYPFYLEAWKPSYEDLQALNRGEPVYLKILGNALPPVNMFTINEEGLTNE